MQYRVFEPIIKIVYAHVHSISYRPIQHNLLPDFFFWTHKMACAIYSIISFIHHSSSVTVFQKDLTNYIPCDCDPEYLKR